MTNCKTHSTTDDDGELVEVVRTLSEEVRVLRLAVDELCEEFQWANRNRGDETHEVLPPFRLWSMPP